MIKKILTALDYGDTCQSVFDQTISLAQATQAQLKLLNVVTLERDSSLTFSPYSDTDFKKYTELYRELETGSFKLIEEFSNKAKEAGVDTEFAQEFGNPGSVICKLGSDWEADLIIVGSHGRKGLSEMLLGSVSNYVVHYATCSVMVAHKPD
ncbi:MAG: universal stress protein [Phormidesmis sp.]